MLFPSRPVRLAGALAAAGAALLGTAASAGAATSLDVTAQCAFPYGDVQPASLTVSFPEGLETGDVAPGSTVTDFASPGLANLGATVAFARTTSLLSMTYTGATTYGNPSFSPEPFAAPTFLYGTLPVEETPGAWLRFPQAGEVTAEVTGLTLNLRAYTESGRVRTWFLPNDTDRNPETVDVPCTLDAGQDLTAAYVVAPRTRPADTTAPSTPDPVTVSELTQTSATLSWGASTDDQGVDRYQVIIRRSPNDAGIPALSTTGTSVTIYGLQRDTAYTYEVRAIDRGPNLSPAATGSFATRRLAADEPVALDLVGGGTITGGRASASFALAGTLDGTVLAVDDSLTGTLALEPSTFTFTRANGHTITATATFTPAGPTTGSQATGTLRATSAQQVRFSDVRLGTSPVSTPAGCRLTQPAQITLTSGDGVFYPQNGGTLAGTATFGRLTDCGAFGALVGPELGTSTDLWVSTTPRAGS